MNMNGYEMLANAVIAQAVEDYRDALIVQHKSKGTDLKANWTVRETERFFTGEDFALYSDADGALIMNTVKKQVIDSGYKRDRHWKVNIITE